MCVCVGGVNSKWISTAAFTELLFYCCNGRQQDNDAESMIKNVMVHFLSGNVQVSQNTDTSVYYWCPSLLCEVCFQEHVNTTVKLVTKWTQIGHLKAN